MMNNVRVKYFNEVCDQKKKHYAVLVNGGVWGLFELRATAINRVKELHEDFGDVYYDYGIDHLSFNDWLTKEQAGGYPN